VNPSFKGAPTPIGKSGFVASGFNGDNANQSLAVAMFSSAFADPLANLGGVNFTGPCSSLPTPDLCRVDSVVYMLIAAVDSLRESLLFIHE